MPFGPLAFGPSQNLQYFETFVNFVKLGNFENFENFGKLANIQKFPNFPILQRGKRGKSA